MADKKYDSTVDAREHIENIKRVAKPIVQDFSVRIIQHDRSKLQDPEKACYDEMIPLLQQTKYGTPEYYKIREVMNEKGLKHHYQVNRHHPEHFENQIADMTLVDLLEMLCDWYAASLRSDTGFEAGFKKNCERFHISKDLEKILWNTYEYYIQGKVK